MRIEGGVSLDTILRILKHGFRTLSYVNWVSASGFQVAALLGVVGLILAVRDGKAGNLSSLLSERTSRTEKFRLVPPGLQNLGNNCFLNVILQVWLLRTLGVFFSLTFCLFAIKNWKGEERNKKEKQEREILLYILLGLLKEEFKSF